MTQAVDIINRPINIDDYVVFHNNIYIVKKLPIKSNGRYSVVSIMLARPSATTRPQKKYSGDLCILPKSETIAFLEEVK